ncbi:hypothetical protein KGV31_002158 [Vibrio parahaemolyticus]|nr:hypothetical protein [Vibrio parahaemolyticus]EHU0344301.1 hypothetical protein [Vibrio parahaemolyticus]EHU0354335.1 hypothetical protein [Vibrio parahaemolyticus]
MKINEELTKELNDLNDSIYLSGLRVPDGIGDDLNDRLTTIMLLETGIEMGSNLNPTHAIELHKTLTEELIRDTKLLVK